MCRRPPRRASNGMNNKTQPRPNSLGVRGLDEFSCRKYHLVVKKVVVHPTPRPRKEGRDLKLVFEAYARTEDGRLGRCKEERLAQHVVLVRGEGGRWHAPDNDDSEFLRALGVADALLDDDATRRLRGRWIIGSPGPAGHDGYNSLADFEPVDPPGPADVQIGPIANPRVADLAAEPAPPDAATGVVYTNLASVPRADAVESALPPPDEPRMAEPSGTARLPDQPSPAGLREILAAFFDERERPSPPRPLSPKARAAHDAFQQAEEACGTTLSDKEAYGWLRDHVDTYDLPKKIGTWTRYLREARRILGTSKHTRRGPLPAGRSLIGPEGASAQADGKRIVRKKLMS